MNLLGLLVEKSILSASDRASIEADLAKKRPLKDALAEHGVSLADALTEAGKVYGLPSRLLGDPPANEEVFSYVPIDSARYYGFVPLDVTDGALNVGTIDPDNIEALDALQFISGKIGMPYKLFLITKEDFDRVIYAYQNLSGEVGKALSEYETIATPESAKTNKQTTPEGTPALGEEALNLTSKSGPLKEDAPVTKIVSTILRYAIDGRSSDVHIEPSPTKTRVRFRMDGNLHTSLELPSKVHEAVIARIKILARLRLDEKRKPQDGRFSATVNKRRIDFRVSTFPTEYGEKVEMRILDQSNATATLESVGFSGEQLLQVREIMRAPYGIILLAGPTGSGKSTTLYAMLSETDRESLNVVSLEDPVEYEIPGVSQSQVRPEIGYDFANGLRSILRQDPDVIMVGEIRDKETAQLAVQAALTGHLVLSTLHTNNATGVIPRLIDMGVDPFLIGPTLILAMAQRLVRLICPESKEAVPIDASTKAMIESQTADLPEEFKKNFQTSDSIYHLKPSPTCPGGTRGRQAVFEMFEMDTDLEKMILKSPSDTDIYKHVRDKGMLTMREDALQKAFTGLIPFEEINNV